MSKKGGNTKGTKFVPSKRVSLSKGELDLLVHKATKLVQHPDVGDEPTTEAIAYSVMTRGSATELQLKHLEKAFSKHGIQADPSFFAKKT